MFENFINRKNVILNYAKKVSENKSVDPDVLANAGMDKEMENLEKEEFKIALIAPFSAGKSTFINSLIGRDILSMEITAETSVITKVRYCEQVHLQIKYRNGEQERIPSNPNESLSIDELKDVLEQKTTVKGENTEETIEEVIVNYPIELCKDKVELVDTPGLFARHAKHKEITQNILPKINAVIFMIDPDSVGETHFTEEIQKYVRNADQSNMEEKGRHIFFVINKIDHYSKEDVKKARVELEKVLEGIIEQPQIYEVSAYYAMLGKMYLCGSIDLDSIRKNKKISVPDPEDPEYTISGRALTEEHVPVIIEESHICQLEQGLEVYLESKNEYLISNLEKKVGDVLLQSMDQKTEEIEMLKSTSQEEKENYIKQMEGLKKEIEIIEGKILRDIKRKVDQQLIGRGSIVAALRDEIEGSVLELGNKVTRKIRKAWMSKRASINGESSAENIIMDIIEQADSELEIIAKEITKTAFLELKKKLGFVIKNAEQDIERIKLEVEGAELNNIGKRLGNMDRYNLDNIMGTLEQYIKENFSETIGEVSQRVGSKISDAKEDNTTITERSGFFYKIKRFFTRKKEYDTHFDLSGFKESLDQVVDEMLEEINGSADAISSEILTLLHTPMENVGNILKQEIQNIVSALINNKRSLINNILADMKSDEKESKNKLKRMEKEIDVLKSLYLELKEAMEEGEA